MYHMYASLILYIIFRAVQIRCGSERSVLFLSSWILQTRSVFPSPHYNMLLCIIKKLLLNVIIHRIINATGRSVYFITTYFLLQDYQQADLCITRVLNIESNNEQAKQLKTLIDDKIRRGVFNVVRCIDYFFVFYYQIR